MKQPDNWKLKPLSALVDPQRPIAYGVVQTGPPVDGGVPCVRVVDLASGRLNPHGMITTSEEISRSYRRTLLQQGDVIFALRGEIGKAAIVDKSLEGANLTRGVALLSSSRKKVDPRFVFQTLGTQAVQREIQHGVNGTGLKEIPIGNLKKVRLPVPPLLEQRKIADILTTWDEALETLDALIVAKDRCKKALMQRLLTGRRRLPGFDNSEGKTESDKFGIWPADWSHLHIGDIAREVSHRNKSGDAFPVLSCTKHRGLVRSEEYFGKRVFAEDTSGYRVVRRGEFAYATNHIEEGSIGYQDLCDAGLVSPIYTVFKAESGVDDRYLFRVLKSPLLIHLYQVNTSASVDRRGSLRYKEFAKIMIWLPPKEEQSAIADVLDTCDAELCILRRQRDALDLQKRGLMQRLLTGKIRVNP